MKKLNVQKMENLLSKIAVFAIMLFVFVCPTFAQDKIVGTLKNKTTMYERPTSSSKEIGILRAGSPVTVLSKNTKGWSNVEFIANEKGNPHTYIGWILTSSYKSKVIEDLKKYPKVDDLYSTGERSTIGCENITPEYDFDHDCTLRINAINANYDTVIKLCRTSNGECIRMVYVRAGTSHDINNIPLDTFFLKIASGEDLRRKTDSTGNCMIIFAEHGHYEKTTTTFSFYREENYKGYTDVGWEFELQARVHSRGQNVNSSNISPNEFNR